MLDALLKGGAVVLVLGLLVFGILIMIWLRRVVPTNMVHIVQSKKATTSYGRGKEAGNVYFAWPAWVPKFGVTVIEFPESIFQVSLTDYEAYDAVRLPFMVDVTAFFRVDDSTVVAQRVSNFKELNTQLDSVLKGAVRRILAKNSLQQIMEARSELGAQFSDEVNDQIKEWGVITVKTIEFMDLRDSKSSNSRVIQNIMAKEQSRIERESRVVVAENQQKAETAEIEAARTIDLNRQEAEQQVGIRTAEKEQQVGLAKEAAQQRISEQAKETAEKNMAVLRVEQERKADIEKEVAILNATAVRQTVILQSQGQLEQTRNEAAGVQAKGEADAKAQELMLMAPVTAQITLAREIGANDGYQQYLVRMEQVRAGEKVGVSMSEALANADLRIISNGGTVGGTTDSSGTNLLASAGGLVDLFTTRGGTNLSGMLAALSQTDEGKALISRLTGGASERLVKDATPASNAPSVPTAATPQAEAKPASKKSTPRPDN